MCTLGGTAKVAVALWLIAIFCSIPYPVLTFLEKSTFYDGTPIEVCTSPIKFPWQQAYIIMTIVIFFTIPLLVLIAVYGLICKKLVIQSHDQEISANPRSSSTLKSRRQVVIMLVIVATLFFVCLLPFKVVSLWLIYAPPSEVEKLGLEGYLNLINFARVMHYINSSVNPVVYNLVSTRFRNYFKKSLICFKKRRRGSIHTWNDNSCDYTANTHKTVTMYTSIENGDHSEMISLTMANRKNAEFV